MVAPLGLELLGGDPPEVVANESDGIATVHGSLGVVNSNVLMAGRSDGVATVAGGASTFSLSIQGYVGIRTVGETLETLGRVAKSNTEPQLPNIDDTSGVGLLSTRRLLTTYFT